MVAKQIKRAACFFWFAYPASLVLLESINDLPHWVRGVAGTFLCVWPVVFAVMLYRFADQVQDK